MRTIVWIALIWVFFACGQEEFITQRNYPFVESIGITDLNDTGVTVNFEILKNGNAGITEFGIEYIESSKLTYSNDPEFMVLAESGAPTSSVVNFRISYDLVDKVDYVVRPYVKSGNTVVYGENLVFQSRGVKPPVINKVSPSQFFIESRIVITGDYFNSVFENNSIEILNSEDYRVSIDSVYRTRIVFSIRANSYIRPQENQKLILQLTSGNKTVRFPTEITSIVPRITQISPNRAYVGDRVALKVSYPIDLPFYTVFLENEQGATHLYYKSKIDSVTANYEVPQSVAGTYVPSLLSSWFPLSSPDQKVEILPTWEKIQEGVDFTYWRYNNQFPVGDYMLSLGFFETGQRHMRKLKLGDPADREVPQISSVDFERSNDVEISDGKKYFYFGIGIGTLQGKAIALSDFHRLNVETDKWERLADFPFESTRIENSFFYKGKLYVVLLYNSNFRVYDPVTNQWSLSSVEVPKEVRYGKSFMEINGELVFLYNLHGESLVHKFSMGASTTLLTKISNEFYSVYRTELHFWDNHLLYLSEGVPLARININTLEQKPIQFQFRSAFYQYLPWPGPDGFKFAFPISQNTYEMEPAIYRLIQDF